VNRPVLDHLSRSDYSPARWHELNDGQPAVLHYWYRQSPAYLEGFDYFRNPWENPPPTISGMVGIRLDTRGRLLSFYAVPPQVDPGEATPGNQNLSKGDNTPSVTTPLQNQETGGPSQQTADSVFAPLFESAGLDLGKFKPTTSQWAPLYMNDVRAAWEGVYPEQSAIPIRVEAASYRGKPVYFEIVSPWDRPLRQAPSGFAGQFSALFTLLISVFVLVLVGSVLLAIRNIRLGRGDTKGAIRLGIFVFIFTLLARLFAAHHVPTVGEFGILLNGLQDATFAGAFLYVVYLALEPFVRKRWPHRIISWSRLLAGHFRDPMVGRDILIGAAFGVGTAVWQLSFNLTRERLGDSTLRPGWEPGAENLGMSGFVTALANQISTPLLNTFQLLFLILLLVLIFRRDWLGFIVGWLVFLSALALLWGGAPAHWINAGVTAGLITFALYRFGLLAALFSIFYLHIYVNFPVTANLTAWYASGFVIELLLVVTIAIYAFYTSLAGQSVFNRKLLED
jgi:serine/threonine-protein kinase